MPKCYSEGERIQIRELLKKEAARCLIAYGAKKTTVDEIVKKVRIPKGTFYLFYSSKEELLMDALLESRKDLIDRLKRRVEKIRRTSDYVEDLSKAVFEFMKDALKTPLIKALNSEDFYLISRKLNPKVVENELTNGLDLCGDLLKSIPVKKEADMKAFSAAFYAMLAYEIQTEKLGLTDETIDKALMLSVRGLVMQLV